MMINGRDEDVEMELRSSGGVALPASPRGATSPRPFWYYVAGGKTGFERVRRDSFDAADDGFEIDLDGGDSSPTGSSELSRLKKR